MEGAKSRQGLGEVVCKESLGKAGSLREVHMGSFLYVPVPFRRFLLCLLEAHYLRAEERWWKIRLV